MIRNVCEIFINFILNFHVILVVHIGKRRACLRSIPAVFASIVLSVAALSSTYAYGISGVIVYENPTDIKQLANSPLQLFIGLGVALAAIAILVIYRARK
ncbi:MAG: hypothetical protein ACRD5H_12475 [Nitrososphaerales archaeon]